jgi:hypothetical protein
LEVFELSLQLGRLEGQLFLLLYDLLGIKRGLVEAPENPSGATPNV